LSKRFYQALGFSIPWSSDDLAYVHHGESSFLLQRFFVQEHSDNFQMHLLVENVDDWWQHVASQRIAEEFGVQVGEPENRPWGMRDFTHRRSQRCFVAHRSEHREAALTLPSRGHTAAGQAFGAARVKRRAS
jgi:hypothetical protein